MITVSRKTEYRFVLEGRAVSFRTRAAAPYKARVRRQARRLFRGPLRGPVEVEIDYFHAGSRRVDMDNVAKCIMDALNGHAYVDDRQVKLEKARAHYLGDVVFLSDGPVDLVKPLQRLREYVVVRIRRSD